MKFRHNAHALWSARRVEVKIVEPIDLILIMLGEPVLRSRESLVLFELYVRRSKRKRDQALSDFGNAIRRGMFHQWRIPHRERILRNRTHVSALNCALMRTNDTVFTKNPLRKD